ncbi:MAG: DUF1788 domain-containing protein [Acidobacteria bacterium]|nr:DUF1788 domain-containing protein [Acidobacteriota bacterium]
MSSLKSDFEELRERIRHGRELGYASFEPIYYLIFHPSQILEVKRETTAWTRKLSIDGWEMHRFSIAKEIESIFVKHPNRQIWLMADRNAPLNWDRTNKSLENALINNNALQNRLERLLETLEGKNNSLVLVTDLEALHPYMRIGAIETNLQGKFHVPTIFLYPGERAGKTNLKFLGFYKEDGNYRSVHVGG